MFGRCCGLRLKMLLLMHQRLSGGRHCIFRCSVYTALSIVPLVQTVDITLVSNVASNNMLAASFDCSLPQAILFIAACTAVLLVRFAL